MAGLQEGYDAWAKDDFKTALAEWGPLAEQGDAIARYELGVMYDTGHGVAQDYKKAANWYTLAAVQGNARAQLGLGLMYYEGRGVAQSYMAAHMWSNISSANGFDRAVGLRDAVAAQMTAADIAKAQSRAQVCLSSNYKNCD